RAERDSALVAGRRQDVHACLRWRRQSHCVDRAERLEAECRWGRQWRDSHNRRRHDVDAPRHSDGAVLSRAPDQQGAARYLAREAGCRFCVWARTSGWRLWWTRRWRRWWWRAWWGAGEHVTLLGVLRRGGRRVGVHGVGSDGPERDVRRQL